jgi:hypothetical protein
MIGNGGGGGQSGVRCGSCVGRKNRGVLLLTADAPVGKEVSIVAFPGFSGD